MWSIRGSSVGRKRAHNNSDDEAEHVPIEHVTNHNGWQETASQLTTSIKSQQFNSQTSIMGQSSECNSQNFSFCDVHDWPLFPSRGSTKHVQVEKMGIRNSSSSIKSDQFFNQNPANEPRQEHIIPVSASRFPENQSTCWSFTTEIVNISHRIEVVVGGLIQGLSYRKLDTDECRIFGCKDETVNIGNLQSPAFTFHSEDNSKESCVRMSNLSKSRIFTSILLILDLIYTQLLGRGKHMTTRQVYYYYVTHFKHQQECNLAISHVCKLLHCPRMSLGIVASPKGKSSCLSIQNPYSLINTQHE